ncbi:MAG: hypothetical protein ACTSXP_00090, partial [Promethearchaeota archaeon]
FVTHVYAVAGNYTVNVTVVDANGDDDSFLLVIQVENPPPPGEQGVFHTWWVIALVGSVLLVMEFRSSRKGRGGMVFPRKRGSYTVY